MKLFSILILSTCLAISGILINHYQAFDYLSDTELATVVGTNNGYPQLRQTVNGKTYVMYQSCAGRNSYQNAPPATCTDPFGPGEGKACIYCNNPALQPQLNDEKPQTPGLVSANNNQICNGPVYDGTCVDGSCANGKAHGNLQCSTNVNAYMMQSSPGGS